jgi:hypothetical protein
MKLKRVTALVTDAGSPVSKANNHNTNKTSTNSISFPNRKLLNGLNKKTRKKYRIEICNPDIAKI